MSDEITIKSKSESTPAANQQNQTVSSNWTQLVNLCAFGLGISFFLPWAQLLVATPSGFDLQKLGDEQLLLWLIPIFCVITILAGMANQRQNFVARITGLLPFIAGFYWYNKIGNDLFQILVYGAYLSLFFGAALLVLPTKSK